MVQLSYETFFILTGWIVAVLGILIYWFRNTLREEIRRVQHDGLVQLEEAQKQFEQQFAETAKRIDTNRQRMEDRRKERSVAEQVIDKEMFPTFYLGPRKSGKTTALLKRSEETGVPILAYDNLYKGYLKNAAKKHGIQNVQVITIEELKRQRPEKVIVDEVQWMFQRLLNVRVDAVSATAYELIELEAKEDWG